jgi:hypothetical protein
LSEPLAIEASGLVEVFGEIRAVDSIDLAVHRRSDCAGSQ